MKDFKDHQSRPADDNVLARVASLVDEWADLNERTDVMNKDTAALEAKANEIAERLLPEIMDENNVKDMTTRNGVKVAIVDKVKAGIRKADMAEGCQWLVDNEHSDLIKVEVTVKFPKGDIDKALELLSYLEQHPEEYAVAMKETVNPQTLGAFVREMLADGEALPMDLLGVYRRREAKITLKK